MKLCVFRKWEGKTNANHSAASRNQNQNPPPLHYARGQASTLRKTRRETKDQFHRGDAEARRKPKKRSLRSRRKTVRGVNKGHERKAKKSSCASAFSLRTLVGFLRVSAP